MLVGGELHAGNGGNGGAGAPGGAGGAASTGAQGEPVALCYHTCGPNGLLACTEVNNQPIPGGTGTTGGAGGDGGASGAGAGGWSFAIVQGGDASVIYDANTILFYGDAGVSNGGGALGKAGATWP
jgi:hypothetical protein